MSRLDPMPASLAERLVARIGADGPLRFSAFMDAALYDEHGGFYATGGQAGRRGDFLTSPEVGPLFGAVLARAIDQWWRDAGSPPRFDVVDAGAGPGTLARAVLAADSACAAGGALHYVAVERAGAQRALHPDAVGSTDRLAVDPIHGVIVANELLDNLAFDVAVWDDGWKVATVGATGGRFVELLTAMPAELAELAATLPPTAAHGARAPLASGACAWLRGALAMLAAGRLVVIDYARPTSELAATPWREWLRTYREHARGDHPLRDPGSQDITADVPLDQLAAVVRPPDRVVTQARFLAENGISELVEEGRQVAVERAHLGDLSALRARSRLREGDALTDPAGLGGFTVAEWIVPASRF